MPLRYTDLDTKKSNYSDFIIRRRFPTLLELFMICVAIISFGVGIVLSVSDKIALCSILFAFGGALCLYVITQLNRSRDLLQATEFENALFASALNQDHAFSFIVNGDETIVYFSPGFKDFFTAFTETGGHDLKAWIEAAQIRDEEAAAIVGAIAGATKAELVCHLFGKQEQQTPCRMLIEPIPRPKGFVLIRCSENAGGQ